MTLEQALKVLGSGKKIVICFLILDLMSFNMMKKKNLIDVMQLKQSLGSSSSCYARISLLD